jgi:hypothetical protein
MRCKNEAIQLKGDLNEGSFDKNTGFITPKYHLMLKDINGGSDNLLFDRVNDPFEQNNLYNDPKYKSVRIKLIKKIQKHYKKYNLPGQDWLKSLTEK